MAASRPTKVVMADRLQEAPAPLTHDRLGRPLVGPCLLWTAALDRQGYGVLGNKEFGTTAIQRAHRVAYALAKSIPLTEIRSIPELDHLCRVTECCSADHLEPVTHAENIRRGDWRNPESGKSHCVHGHEYTPENTRYGQGQRFCRTCQRERNRANYDPAKRSARYCAKRMVN